MRAELHHRLPLDPTADEDLTERSRVKETDLGSLLTISEGNNPTLAVTTITYVSICARRWPMIISHATACNFLLNGFLFSEVGLNVIVCIALQWLLVPTRARHAQAMLELVAPQLQIGSG